MRPWSVGPHVGQVEMRDLADAQATAGGEAEQDQIHVALDTAIIHAFVNSFSHAWSDPAISSRCFQR